jgi:hypothetical protein
MYQKIIIILIQQYYNNALMSYTTFNNRIYIHMLYFRAAADP